MRIAVSTKMENCVLNLQVGECCQVADRSGNRSIQTIVIQSANREKYVPSP